PFAPGEYVAVSRAASKHLVSSKPCQHARRVLRRRDSELTLCPHRRIAERLVQAASQRGELLLIRSVPIDNVVHSAGGLGPGPPPAPGHRRACHGRRAVIERRPSRGACGCLPWPPPRRPPSRALPKATHQRDRAPSHTQRQPTVAGVEGLVAPRRWG